MSDTQERVNAFAWPRPAPEWSIPALEQARTVVQDRMLAIDEETTSIDSQLAEAKGRVAETGEYSDRDWFRRANTARRIKGRERQRCQQLLGDINRMVRRKNAEADAVSPERRFINAARAMLPKETYDALWRSANYGEASFQGVREEPAK